MRDNIIIIVILAVSLLLYCYYPDERSTATDQTKHAHKQLHTLLCPDPKVLSPCRCSHSGSNAHLTLDCSDATKSSTLQRVLNENFPVKDFSKFSMYDNLNINHLNQTHSIRFKRIDIRNSSLESIAPTFLKASASHLRELNIKDSIISDFPLGQLQVFPVLKRLTISIAMLKKLPHIMGKKLNDIDFEGNEISSIEKETFRNVPNLRTLHMNGNFIHILKRQTIPIRSGMEAVSFGGNPLSHIESGSFYDGSDDLASAGLNYLVLSNCKLTSLGDRTVPLTQLTELINLEHNALSFISPGAFFILSEPEPDSVTVILRDNKLTTIHEGTFKEIMNYTKALNLEGNPLGCGCDVAWIVRDANLMRKILGTCVDGTSFSALHPEDFQYCP